MSTTEERLDYDVVIVGAGLSGIGTAYWLQKKCPQRRFTILEARRSLGGTWDLFRYPGIRSDSDMFTFGYRFKPWKNPQSLSNGGDILSYLQEVAQENGIDQKIQYEHQVVSSDWCAQQSAWAIQVKHRDQMKTIRTRFLYMCGGYYDYDQAYRPQFPGEEDFRGTTLVPQFWPKSLEYTGKKVVVVGSGATAVTLVPAMADKAAHVTMLQRSPTYVMNLPNRNGLYIQLRKWLPDQWAYRLTRWQNLGVSMMMYELSQRFPRKTKNLIMREAAKELPPDFEVEKHFNPAYNPWEQRLCVIPDGDLFRMISQGKVSVVTDHIDRFTEAGILLNSGQELLADIIVLATGLSIRLLGGSQIKVEGKTVSTQDVMVYKGMMLSDVPNFAIAFGYTNASWTLKTDLTANYICKLLNYMDKKGYRSVVPQRQPHVTPEPFLNFSSSYIQRANYLLPQQGGRRPWRVYQNYLLDALTMRLGRINDGVLKFNGGEEK